jgi:hypothetical protein
MIQGEPDLGGTGYFATLSGLPAGDCTIGAFGLYRGTEVNAQSVSVRVNPLASNSPPSVSLTTPAAASIHIAPGVVRMEASASDPDPGDTVRVQFFADGGAVGPTLSAPFRFDWAPPVPTASATHTLMARAVDSRGASRDSAAITITVARNQAPTISITAPTVGQVVYRNEPFEFAVNATDPDTALSGGIAGVEFFEGARSLGIDTQAPFSVQIDGFGNTGNYALRAVARDRAPIAASAEASIALTVLPNSAPSIVRMVSPAPCPVTSVFLGINPCANAGPAASTTRFLNNEYRTGQLMVLTAVVDDPEANVSSVEFWRDRGDHPDSQKFKIATATSSSPASSGQGSPAAPNARIFSVTVPVTQSMESGRAQRIYAVAIDRGRLQLSSLNTPYSQPETRWSPVAVSSALSVGAACNGAGWCSSTAPHSVPGLIEAERYNTGRQGVGFFETDLYGGSWADLTQLSTRLDDVDLEPTCASGPGDDCAVNFTSAGEWLAYSLYFSQGGTYQIRFCFRNALGVSPQPAAGSAPPGGVLEFADERSGNRFFVPVVLEDAAARPDLNTGSPVPTCSGTTLVSQIGSGVGP